MLLYRGGKPFFFGTHSFQSPTFRQHFPNMPYLFCIPSVSKKFKNGKPTTPSDLLPSDTARLYAPLFVYFAESPAGSDGSDWRA